MKGSSIVSILFTLIALVDISFALLVRTFSGVVFGKVTPEAESYLGIPYAEPPVRNLRWRSPRVKRPWRGIYDARYFRPKCPQRPCTENESYGGPCSNEMSEDCLHLNIYAPRGSRRGSNLPVYFFVHGGFFIVGSAVETVYNGETFVRKSGIILVTINYRLGTLGSLFTGPGGIRGNFAIKDQRLAMNWVHHNIYNFGGDPRRVSIFGHSAGASYVAMHLVNRRSDLYFSSATMISAPIGIRTKTARQAISVGRSFSANLGCQPDDRLCLRSRSMEDILRAQGSTSLEELTFLQRYLGFAPAFDDDEIPIDVQFGLRRGLIGNKNVIFGTTKDENAQYIIDFFPEPVDITEYQQRIVPSILPDQALAMLQRYVPQNPLDTRRELRQILDDVVFTCVTRRIAIDLSQYRRVWFYIFDSTLDFLRGTSVLSPCQRNACHQNVLPYLFQSVRKMGYQTSFLEERLANELTISSANFARTGRPSSPLVPWPRYRRVSLYYKRFMKLVSPVQRDFRGRRCELFDQNGFYA